MLLLPPQHSLNNYTFGRIMSDNNTANETAPVPSFELADTVFLAQQEENEQLINKITKSIRDADMGPYYYYLYYDMKLPGLEWDQSLYDEMIKSSEAKVKDIESEIEKLEKEDESEIEVLKKWTQLGEYYAQIGDSEKAEKTILKTIELAPSTGSKIDLLLLISRIGFFYNDLIFVKKYLDKAKTLIDKGGDWERRNKYKTYYGVYLVSIRQFEEASQLLHDSLTTFTCTELTTYEKIAQYAIMSGSITFERNDLKGKLIESSEILSVNSNNDLLLPIYKLVKSLYFTEYINFFPSLLETYDLILVKDRNLKPHADYYLREIRCRAYSQLLESYRTLSLKSMAKSFGVGIEFLDDDLSKFIPNKKLNCIIDRVEGIVQTNRSENKNAQYHQLIKNGDALLTKLQKYGAAVRLSGAEKV